MEQLIEKDLPRAFINRCIEATRECIPLFQSQEEFCQWVTPILKKGYPAILIGVIPSLSSRTLINSACEPDKEVKEAIEAGAKIQSGIVKQARKKIEHFSRGYFTLRHAEDALHILLKLPYIKNCSANGRFYAYDIQEHEKCKALTRANKVYFAPGMPGAKKAQVDFAAFEPPN